MDDMHGSSALTDACARKIVSTVLQAAHGGRQVQIAAALGVNESTVSRLLSDHLPKLAEILARCGLKVVPAHWRCVDPDVAKAMDLLHSRAIERAGGAVKLMWEDET